MQQKIITFVRSEKCFYIIVGLLIFQAAWIALTGRFPMAFDEDYHLGLIRLYAHHISPFWANQPPHADMYGALFRDPSYLYHYLMSFPYRLLNIFVHGQTCQVLGLRFINIGLFAAALPLFRRLLLMSGASRAVVHAVLALFVLLPIAPFLAAQINYDNLFIPLVAAVLLSVAVINRELVKYGRINMTKFLELLVLAMLTSLVKYAFLPVLIAITIFLAVQFYRRLGRKKRFWITVGFGLTLMTKKTRWVLLIAVLISTGLFAQRYGINLIRYHEPVPDCQQVLNIQRCSAYSPWLRDYTYSAQKGQNLHGPIGFSGDWLYGMWFRTFFAVAGPGINFETRGPLLLPGSAAIIFAAGGSAVFIWKAKAIFKRYDRQVLALLLAVTVCYVALLWFDEYKGYLHAGEPVAINGRYLLPVLPAFMLLLGLGFTEALRQLKWLQIGLAGLALLCFMWGGGLLTFIIRSREAWYWPNHYVVTVNQAVQNSLYHVVPGTNNPTQFLR